MGNSKTGLQDAMAEISQQMHRMAVAVTRSQPMGALPRGTYAETQNSTTVRPQHSGQVQGLGQQGVAGNVGRRELKAKFGGNLKQPGL